MKLVFAIIFAAFAFSAPAFAQSDPVTVAEIRQLRELLTVYDRLYTQQFEAQKLAVASALAAAKDATTKAEIATEKRLEGVNEFRGQLKDQAGTFVTRAEMWGYFVGSVGVIGVLFTILFRMLGLERKKSDS